VPSAGDGLLFTDPAKKQEDWGFLLNNAPVAHDKKTITFIVPRLVAPGFTLSITSSRELETRARQIITHPPAGLAHRIPVDISIGIGTGGRISIEGRLESGSGNKVRVSYQPDFALVPARSRPLSCDQLEAQVRRSGDTPFVIRNCSIVYDGSLFAPLSELNRMRREFLARAEEALLTSSVPSGESIAQSRRRLAAAFPEHPSNGSRDAGATPMPLTLAIYADSPEAVAMAVKEGCSSICFEPAVVLPRHTCRAGAGRDARSIRHQVTETMACCRDAGARFVLKLPRITRDDYLAAVLPEIALLHKDGLAACMVENPGTAHAIRSLLPDMALSGAAGLNIFNHRSACHLSPPFRSLTLSPELSRDECRELVRAAQEAGCSASFALIVQGISEAMVTEDCLVEPVRHCREDGDDGGKSAFFGIRDKTGHIFPVMTDGECRTRIGNAVETCLIDHLPAIRKAGISELVIDTRGRTGAYASAMTQVYRDAIARCDEGSGAGDTYGPLKERVKSLAYGGITAGHYLRGLKE
jgi:putative protease